VLFIMLALLPDSAVFPLQPGVIRKK